MKKLFTLFAMMFLLVGGLFAQKLSYQAVVRDNDNKLVVNTALTVEVSILNANNGVQYAETHNATSNQNGLIVLTIGEGTVTSGTNLSAVNWEGATINSVIKNGGTTVATISSPVNAVPYALQAANTSGSFSQVQADWNETNTASKAYIVNKPDLSVFITTETDPTVPAWAKATTKPAYDYSEIVNTPTIPTTVAQLTDASDYAKAADVNTALAAKADANNVYTKAQADEKLGAKADTAVVNAALAGKANTSDIPTTVAQLTDAGDYAKTADVNTALGAKADTATVNAALAGKANTSDIPTTVAELSDASDYAKLTDIHNNTITIQKNGETVASFTLNQNTDQTINLTVPTSGGSGGGVPQSISISGNVITLSDGGGSVTLPAETDPTVSAWAKETSKPAYDYSEIANTPTIPTTVAELTDANDYAKTADVNTALGAKADTATVNAALATVNDAIATKANADDVYTKAQADEKLGAKADTATVNAALATVNDAIATKANADDVYTKAQADEKLGAKADTATVNAALATVNTALDTKANSADVYTKAQADEKLGAKADTATVNAALATVNDAIATKANSADVYTKAQADEKLGAKADTATVNAALATVNDAIATKANADDVYTKAQTDEKLGAKADTATVNAALALKANAADVYTKTEMNTALNGKADTASVYTRDVMNTKLADKANNNAVFTKDETKDAISDSLDIIRAQMAALATQVNNLMTALNALQVTSEKFIATAGQTSFTLGGTPNGNVVCYVNGVMVGSTSATSANTVITVSGTTATYHPSYNYSYSLQAGDVVTFMYVVRANN